MKSSFFSSVLTSIKHKGFISLIDQGIINATNFFTGVIISRACTKEEFGIYTLGFSIIAFLIGLQTSIISTPYIIYSPKITGEHHIRYTGSTIIHQLAFSLVAVIFLTIGGILLSQNIGASSLKSAIWALTAVVTFMLFREFIRRVCFALLKIRIALVVDIGVAIIQVSGLLVLAQFDLLGASHAFEIMGLACIVVTFFWLVTFRKNFSLNLTDAIEDFHRNFAVSKWIFLSGLLWFASTQIYPWLLTIFHGPESAAVFGVCVAAVALARPIVHGLNNFIEPKLAHIYAQNGCLKLRQFAIKASIVLIGLISLFCVTTALLGNKFIILVYGNKYAGNGAMVFLLALNMLVIASNFPFSRSLFTIERADVEFKSNLLTLGLTISLGLWLVKVLGPPGAAISLMVSNIAGSGFRYIAFEYLLRAKN